MASLILYYSAVGNNTVFWDDGYPIANEISIAIILIASLLVEDLHPRSYTRILVYNRAPYKTIRTDADSRMTAIYISLHPFERLVGIGPHHQNAFKAGAMLYTAANADNRIGDDGPVDYAPFRDYAA